MFKYKGNLEFNSPHYSNYKSSGGYTLIEVLITIGVFTVGILGALGFSAANYRNSEDNVDRVKAINLAREGIELIKNVRDSNWLRIDGNASCGGNDCTWDYGLDGSTNYMIMSYNDIGVDNKPTFLSTVCNNSITNCVNTYITNNEGVELYLNGSGRYDHDNTGTATKFSRVIKIDRICMKEEPLVSEGGDPNNFEYIDAMSNVNVCRLNPNDIHVGFALTSHVQWEDNGTKYVEIPSAIYNWRR